MSFFFKKWMLKSVPGSQGDRGPTAAPNTDSRLVNAIQFTLLFDLPKGGKRKLCDKPKGQTLYVTTVIQPSNTHMPAFGQLCSLKLPV